MIKVPAVPKWVKNDLGATKGGLIQAQPTVNHCFFFFLFFSIFNDASLLFLSFAVHLMIRSLSAPLKGNGME